MANDENATANIVSDCEDHDMKEAGDDDDIHAPHPRKSLSADPHARQGKRASLLVVDDESATSDVVSNESYGDGDTSGPAGSWMPSESQEDGESVPLRCKRKRRRVLEEDPDDGGVEEANANKVPPIIVSRQGLPLLDSTERSAEPAAAVTADTAVQERVPAADVVQGILSEEAARASTSWNPLPVVRNFFRNIQGSAR
jgi:hypothetical protein